MPFKARVESEDLKRFKILDQRMLLTADEKKYYKALLKGYEGEVQFDSLTEKLQSDSFILNDLVLEVNRTKFQIDSFQAVAVSLSKASLQNFLKTCYPAILKLANYKK